MKRSALEHLVCLNCASALVLNAGYTAYQDDADEIMTGTLGCMHCQRQYQVLRGIPRFVDTSLSSAVNLATGRSFAVAWKTFPRLTNRYRQQFFDWIYPIGPGFFKDKLVLECGCGKGRHANLVAECGARAVFAVDIGEAVEIAYENVGRLPGVHIVQSDIDNLPFKAVFDFAFSVGVLHHMDSPRTGFLSITKKLHQSGSILVWVYGLENNWWLVWIINPIRLAVTSKLPSLVLWLLSAFMAIPVYLTAKLVASPWNKLQSRFNWLPTLFYQDYLSYIADFDFVEIHHIVFDHLIAPVANYIAKDDLQGWFRDALMPNPIIRWHNKNSWIGFGTMSQSLQESISCDFSNIEKNKTG